MKINVLSRNRFSYSNRRLREEAKALKHSLQVIDPMEFEIVLGRQTPLLFRNGKPIRSVDVVIPRMGASINHYGLAVVSQFEMMGVTLLNHFTSIVQTRNKLHCIQLLTGHDIDIPRTIFIRRPSEVASAVKMVGGFPVVLKLLSGSHGIGVMLAESMRTIESTLDTLWSLGQDILIQECVKESVGRDVRVVVVGGKVIAAMRRQARIGEFRSNIHRGAVGTPIDLSSEIERTAVQAAKIVGLEVAGVDLLESKDGPKVIEINSAPGLQGIESVTGMNVARKILERAQELTLHLPLAKHG